MSKLSVEVSKAMSTLTKAETQVSRQHTQSVQAPRDGTIVRLLQGEGNQLVKSGDALVVFAPDVTTPAVEMWISGNDLRFVERGAEAQVQFEGWPRSCKCRLAVGGDRRISRQSALGRLRQLTPGQVSGALGAAQAPWPSSNFLRLKRQRPRHHHAGPHAGRLRVVAAVEQLPAAAGTDQGRAGQDAGEEGQGRR